MDRRSLIKNAGMAGVLAAGVAPAVVNAQAAVRWRLSSSFPKALDTIHGAAEVFAKQVKAMSGGKFEISTTQVAKSRHRLVWLMRFSKVLLKWLIQHLITSLVKTKHLLWVARFHLV